MPATWSGERCGRRAESTITEAVGRWSSQEGGLLGIASTWALATASIACTVQVSSPSSARW